MRATVWKAAIGCGVVLAGCGGGSSHPDGGLTGGGVALDDYASAVVTAICQRAVDCSLYPNVATCAATRGIADGTPNLAFEVDIVKQGLARYDPVAAAACLDALPRTCWTLSDWNLEKWQFFATSICRKVFTGAVPPGGACCGGIMCTTQMCNVGGSCAPEPLVSLGGHCDSNANLQCDFDLVCSPEGRCEGLLPIGASCPDVTWQVCAPPAGCPIAGPTPGICTARPDEGEPCDFNDPNPCLRLDDYCDPDTDICTRRIPAGAPCTSINVYPCVRFAPCTNGVCTPAPALGDPCRSDGTCFDLRCVDNVCSPWPTAAPGVCGL